MKTVKFVLGLLLLAAVLVWYFWPVTKLSGEGEIDRIEVYKSRRKLRAFSNGQYVGEFSISLGENPIGHKQFEGDEKTPSGEYTIDSKNSRSGYFLSLGISYPNSRDISYAKQFGRSPGGQVKIHGLPNGSEYLGRFHRFRDWTDGCIALTNDEVKQLYSRVVIGATIEIFEY